MAEVSGTWTVPLYPAPARLHDALAHSAKHSPVKPCTSSEWHAQADSAMHPHAPWDWLGLQPRPSPDLHRPLGGIPQRPRGCRPSAPVMRSLSGTASSGHTAQKRDCHAICERVVQPQRDWRVRTFGARRRTRSMSTWSARYTSGGCVRWVPGSCGMSNDFGVRVGGTKAPWRELGSRSSTLRGEAGPQVRSPGQPFQLSLAWRQAIGSAATVRRIGRAPRGRRHRDRAAARSVQAWRPFASDQGAPR